MVSAIGTTPKGSNNASVIDVTMSERGCGTRKEGGLYLTVPLSKNGKPIEYFLIDPCVPWTGGVLRGPEIFSLEGEELKHVVMGVGATYYPFVPDFVQEAAVMGISKRVPRNIDLSGLVPGESRLLLMHPKAIPQFDYTTFFAGQKYDKGAKLNPRCPKMNLKEHICIGDLWPLSAQPEFSSDKHQVSVDYILFGDAMVKTPSTTYRVIERQIEIAPPMTFQAGLFARFPVFGFEYVSKKGAIPRTIAEKFQQSSFDLSVVPE